MLAATIFLGIGFLTWALVQLFQESRRGHAAPPEYGRR